MLTACLNIKAVTQICKQNAKFVPMSWIFILPKRSLCRYPNVLPFGIRCILSYRTKERDKSISYSRTSNIYTPNFMSKQPIQFYYSAPYSNSSKDRNPFTCINRKVGTLAATIVNNSAPALQPYMKLMRIDKPIGSWLLFWPCSWSIAMSAAPGCFPDLQMLALFGLGAFVMRGAGCTINDMWDKDIDDKVSRTKDRPLVTGAITQFDALVFLSGQLGVGLLVLLQLNWYSILLGASSLGLVIIYPLMKRVTHWPQFILGMAFNWGALLGWSAVNGSCNWFVCLPLYTAGICWTLIYDTIYAHQDKVEDILLGIKSTAIKFGENTKLWLSGFGGTMISGLLATGIQCHQTWPYYASVGLVAAHLATQLYTLNINNPADCSSKFISNKRIGLLLFVGIIAGTLMKSKENNRTNEVSNELECVR